MPNKLTINHIMNMIQAHNELVELTPITQRLGAYIEFDDGGIFGDGKTGAGLISLSFEYFFSVRQLWDALNDNFSEEFLKTLMCANFKTNPNTLYLEAEFDFHDSMTDEITHYRFVVSIWER